MSARRDTRTTASVEVGSGAAATRAYPWRGFAISLALLAISGLAAWGSSTFIGVSFPDRPLPRDLLLDAVPYARPAQYVADSTVALAMVVLTVHLWRRHRDRIPAAITIFAIMYILRGAINVLTPLASPHQQELYGWLPSQNGMFPSGHSANVLLCWLLAEDAPAPARWLALAIMATETIALLVSRGHYSIDIVGGFLLGYFVWAEWTRGTLFAPLKRLVER